MIVVNKIVRKHYPAAKLPSDLRGNIQPNARVAILIEEEPVGAPSIEALRLMVQSLEKKDVSETEAVTRIRQLRDEWDD
jgi:hypothetical protein